jgi:hypothetical protein
VAPRERHQRRARVRDERLIISCVPHSSSLSGRCGDRDLQRDKGIAPAEALLEVQGIGRDLVRRQQDPRQVSIDEYVRGRAARWRTTKVVRSNIDVDDKVGDRRQVLEQRRVGRGDRHVREQRSQEGDTEVAHQARQNGCVCVMLALPRSVSPRRCLLIDAQDQLVWFASFPPCPACMGLKSASSIAHAVTKGCSL